MAEVRKLFGEPAVKAAKLHLIRDFGRVRSRQGVEEVLPEEPELASWDELG